MKNLYTGPSIVFVATNIIAPIKTSACNTPGSNRRLVCFSQKVPSQLLKISGSSLSFYRSSADAANFCVFKPGSEKYMSKSRKQSKKIFQLMINKK